MQKGSLPSSILFRPKTNRESSFNQIAHLVQREIDEIKIKVFEGSRNSPNKGIAKIHKLNSISTDTFKCILPNTFQISSRGK